jgi:hypothetical protein
MGMFSKYMIYYIFNPPLCFLFVDDGKITSYEGNTQTLIYEKLSALKFRLVISFSQPKLILEMRVISIARV